MAMNKVYTLILLLIGASSVLVMTQAQTVSKLEKKFTVTLDAGHGGHDPGAVGTISQEKNITLSVIRKLGKKIAEENSDVKVVYTRQTDKYITLQGRADIANNAKSDIFISVHVNANNNHDVSGCETYTLGLHKTQSNLDVAMRENSVILLEDNYNKKYEGFNPKSVDSYIMFECIQDRYVDKSVWFASQVEKNFGESGRKDRGVRQAGFWVLHKTAMPAVLVEIGYITNGEEEKYLNTEEGQQTIANAIYDAFLRFRREYELKSGNQEFSVDKVAKEKSQTKQDSIDKVLAVENKRRDNVAKKTETKNITYVTDVEHNNAQQQSVETAIQKEKKYKKESCSNNVEYALQICALSKKIKTNSPTFKGLKVECYVEGGLYKYVYGKTESYVEVLREKKNIAGKFPNAIIVAFRNGEKISVSEAKKFQNRD